MICSGLASCNTRKPRSKKQQRTSVTYQVDRIFKTWAKEMLVREQWYDLASKLNGVTLNDLRDSHVYKLSRNGKFSVKSVYMHLTRDDNGLGYTNMEGKAS
jgi:hypothetical protein